MAAEEDEHSKDNTDDEKDNDTFQDAEDDAEPRAADNTANSAKTTVKSGKEHGKEGTQSHTDALGISGTEMDHVKSVLDRAAAGDDDSNNSSLGTIPQLRPDLPSRRSVTSPLKGLSGDLPPVGHPPPPATTIRPPRPAERGSRKMASPFAWLSRATSGRKPSVSPPRTGYAGGRRGTMSSVLSQDGLAAVGEMDGGQGRHSLKDRFQQLRIESEEASGKSGDIQEGSADGETTEAVQDSSMGTTVQISSPKDDGPKSPVMKDPVNSKLPPGTAAGVSVGPSSSDEGPINWDLWQGLVNDGPAAVAQQSGTELRQAVASGIPPPIRGVVWQVLGQSKNEDLESVYWALVAKSGQDDAAREQSMHSPPAPLGVVNGLADKDRKPSVNSSSSSVHSEHTTPMTSAMHSPMPQQEDSLASPSIDRFAIPSPAEKPKIEPKSVFDDDKALKKLEKAIRRDLGSRTSFSKYIASANLQEGLFGICKAYALYDEEVGYAQGMNFIAMPLLFNMPEEEAFTLFVRLMSSYDLRSLFTPNMTGLHLRLFQFERLLEEMEPTLYCHLHRRGVSPNLYATQWFLTLFAYRFPLQLVQRIYDLILTEGLTAILKFGIVLMQKNAQTLLGMSDMSQITTFLKEKLFDVYIDKTPSAASILDSGFFGSTSGIDKEIYRADALVHDACAIDINADTLSLYAAEFEDTARIESERQAELDKLRSNNTTLTSKVKTLEERVQQHDTEHVGIASDLVRTKVENESLNDVNESLKMQVDELRKMVETQPAEVEARLEQEMQRIMVRNVEVQNQNRMLEDQMEEMERELVDTKLKFAQMNAEHDALKQRVTTIQSMLSAK